jgi:hypothetical protein
MYTPTIDDEVQITRKIYGLNVMFGIVKKKKLSLIDKIKKFFGKADAWIDYEYVSGIYYDNDLFNLGFKKIHIDHSIVHKVEQKYNIKNKLRNVVKSLTINHIQDGFTIYGVIYGKEIDSVYHYGVEDVEFVGTDIFEDKQFIAPDAVKLIFDNLLELPHIEIINTGEWNQEIQDNNVYDCYFEQGNVKFPHIGVTVKHVSGDREKITSVFNPDFLQLKS